MTQPIIRFEGVSKAFGTQTVLRDFSLDVEPGAFVSIIGRSGCGKTTVLKLVNGLLSPDTGRVLIQGQDVARIDPVALRRRIGLTGGVFRTVRAVMPCATPFCSQHPHSSG